MHRWKYRNNHLYADFKSASWKSLEFFPLMLMWMQWLYFGRILGVLFFYEFGGIKSLPWLKAFNIWLMENGFNPPWILSRKICKSFWYSIDNSERYVGNRPADYGSKNTFAVGLMEEFWRDYVKKDDSILEIGCNAGANLKELLSLGYSRLSGIEINPKALDEFITNSPGAASKVLLLEGSAEDNLPAMESKSVDVIFTMAVLMHVHPKSNFIFKEMARVAKKWICVFEDEDNCRNYIFPRNYGRIFRNLGCFNVKAKKVDTIDPNYNGYTLRLIRI